MGSLPHMRGKEYFASSIVAAMRITPAHAGKNCRHQCREYMAQDHPRVCGEKKLILTCVESRLGSPPRMRGKVDCRAHKTALTGITPAYAGKSFWLLPCPSCCKDHPRVCGEKCLPASPKTGQGGSPPRMRGKVPIFADPIDWDRITPAHAGKSPDVRRRTRKHEDHPRACGEKFGSTQPAPDSGGSPPRMRGKDDDGGGTVCQLGITPAHAGKRQ